MDLKNLKELKALKQNLKKGDINISDAIIGLKNLIEKTNYINNDINEVTVLIDELERCYELQAKFKEIEEGLKEIEILKGIKEKIDNGIELNEFENKYISLNF